ncbi:MAG: nucleotidyltransferase family protein [Oscillospiraceae bacterium]|nr:nucleotidyltransferase family protein [Oscillospiraceae bacterium]
MKDLKIGCVIMAAGNGSRFGENKLTILVDGKSMIRRAMEAVPKDLETVVVTQYAEVSILAEEFGFSCVSNEHPEWGISHTIALGTEHLSHCDGILYMVSDQPLLRRESVEKLVEVWKSQPHRIAGASHNGKRGNPCLFPRKFFPDLCALNGDTGGNTVIRANAEALLLVDFAKQELRDVDTPETLRDISK